MEARIAAATTRLMAPNSQSLVRTVPSWDTKLVKQSHRSFGPISILHETVVDNRGAQFEREILGRLALVQELDDLEERVPGVVTSTEIAIRRPELNTNHNTYGRIFQDCLRLFAKQQGVIQEMSTHLSLSGTKVLSPVMQSHTPLECACAYFTTNTVALWNNAEVPADTLIPGMDVILTLRFHRVQYKVFGQIYFRLLTEVVCAEVVDALN
ncbi:hypothetical protein VNI00_016555 [Paramarasmius palmivorus]|uniref:Uncharacterized protein n=1 Tax=Paramarasmius palmivorus TaxID=297713 RepID=A0AAW0BC14_9AGAR